MIGMVGIVEDIGEAATVAPMAGVMEAACVRIPSRLRQGEGAIAPSPFTLQDAPLPHVFVTSLNVG
jgi:hypothetical protein